MTDTPPQPETISQLLDAVYPSFALLAGMELELFTALEGDPTSFTRFSDSEGREILALSRSQRCLACRPSS